jgi:small subunit ribosomal protein S13
LSSKLICKILGYDVNVKTNELNQTDWDKIYSIIKVKYKFILDSEIKKTISDNIKKMKNIKCYKGMRHSFNLPVNGQRTHTNARTKGWR